MTPLHRTNDDVPNTSNSKKLSDYVDAILNICEKHNISVIDLFNINPLDKEDKELLPDGLHPSDKGHIIMEKVIAEKLIKLD